MKKYFFIFILLSAPAFAKTLSYQKSRFSTYLRGGYALNNTAKNAYQPGFPGTISFPDTSGIFSGYNAEIGLAFGTGSNTASFKIGAEVINPMWTDNLAGKNAGGTQLVTLQSEVFALIPKIDVELYISNKPTFRAFFGMGGGYAYATIKNTVSLTAAGQAAFPGLQNYVEEGTGTSLTGKGFVGLEFLFFDNVGFSIDAGYQYLLVNNFRSTRNTTTTLQTITSGNLLMNNNGTARTIDFSGPYICGAFHFYL